MKGFCTNYAKPSNYDLITLLCFNALIKLYYFDVTRLHSINGYDYNICNRL